MLHAAMRLRDWEGEDREWEGWGHFIDASLDEGSLQQLVVPHHFVFRFGIEIHLRGRRAAKGGISTSAAQPVAPCSCCSPALRLDQFSNTHVGQSHRLDKCQSRVIF